MIEKIERFGKSTVGPVSVAYVEWVLKSARERGIRRLYFLARDAYLLYKIAKSIQLARDIDIDIRYLYCSRQSLRLPSYHLIGEEAFQLLFSGGYYLTKKSVVERAAFSKKEAEELLSELKEKDVDKPLSKSEFDKFKTKLLASDKFLKTLMEKSKKAYPLTIEYLKAEGLFDGISFGLVDSGWTGSMQRSLRQLLEGAGEKPHITGFYFGMYKAPQDVNDGEYLCFYFSKNRGAFRKMNFNNNVFEIMLSANHPMTTGYKKDCCGNAIPVFKNPQAEYQTSLVNAQIEGALFYMEEYISIGNAPPDYKKSLKDVYKILKRCLVKPSREFASVYGSFSFCDDVTEGYHFKLADEKMKKSLKRYMLIPRIIRRVLKTPTDGERELFWPYGVVAFCHPIARPWYRFNIRAWELAKALLK